jgi:hypothetical protein
MLRVGAGQPDQFARRSVLARDDKFLADQIFLFS